MRTDVNAEHYIFASDIADRGYRSSVVVYWSAIPYGVETAVPAIDRFTRSRDETHEVWCVYPRDLSELYAAMRALPTWKGKALDRSINFRFFAVDLDGKWKEEDTPLRSQDGPPIEATPQAVDAVIEDGLRQLFRDSDALEEPSAGYHFARARSGRHAPKFLRASQTVARAQHAFFVAMAMLRMVKIDPSARLCVDTAGIAPAMYAVKELVRRLGDGNESIHVDSFGSYEGYEDNLDSRTDVDWVIISSSTSGSLAKEIIVEEKVQASNVLTLYYLSDVPFPAGRGAVLCDLTNRDAHPMDSVRDARLRPYATYDTNNGGTCALCQKGSQIIELVGDGFFPLTDGLRLRMLRLNDRPRTKPSIDDRPTFDNDEYFNDFYGLNAIRAGRAAHQKRSTHVTTTVIGELFDADRTDAEHIRAKVAADLSALIEDATAPIAAVLSLHDEDSWAMAKFVAKTHLAAEFVELGEFNVILPAGAFLKDERRGSSAISEVKTYADAVKLIPNHSTVIACAGVLSSGRSLMSLNRDLRDLDSSVDIRFLIAVAHPENDGQQEIFERTLSRKSSEDQSHFVVGWQLPREPQSPGETEPWQRERTVLAHVDGWLERENHDPELARAVERRTRQLERLRPEDLFVSATFGSPEEHSMPTINPKFALWPTDWKDHPRTTSLGVAPSQAEVLATVAHLMYHSRRHSKDLDPDGGTRRHGYALNPAVFDRYNDPQLQASILRAAEPGELDYSMDPDASRSIADIVDHLLGHLGEEGGEATYEFLLSVAHGLERRPGAGMRLTTESLRSVLKRAGGETDFADKPPLLRALLLYIRSRP